MYKEIKNNNLMLNKDKDFNSYKRYILGLGKG
jgi:hypothetical protein